AGLQCFAMPVAIDADRNLAVIGGRAFARGIDYRETVERFRSGDLQGLASEEIFRNIIFADEADLDHAALRISKAAGSFKSAAAEILPQQAVPVAVLAGGETESQQESPLETKPGADSVRVSESMTLADSIRRFAE